MFLFVLELTFTVSILAQKDLCNIFLIFSVEMIQVKRKITQNCKEVVVYLLHMRLPGQQNMEQSNPYPMEFIF